MSSVKIWMVSAAAGAAVCGSFGAFAQQAPTLVIGKHSQVVQTPTTVPSGAVYQATGAQTAALTAYTEGFLFCSNFASGATNPLPVKLDLHHEDQRPSPAHRWSVPSALAEGLAYNGGRFVVNPGLSISNLTCHSFGVEGELVSGLNDGVFDNGYDSATETNYKHLVNWVPSTGFDWNAPDWSQIPAGACDSEAYQQAKAPENVGCAALTGIRGGTVRAPTMWTATNGVTFTYLFRVDTRFGAPAPGAQAKLEVPQLSVEEVQGTPASMQMQIRDAYDVDSLSDTGTYCSFIELPTTLDTNVCATAGVAATPLPGDGFLNMQFAVGSQLPAPVSQSFYVAVNRQFKGHLSVNTPIASASIFVDPAIVPEGADKFSGDNVVFGFMPTSTGFPWMSGQ